MRRFRFVSILVLSAAVGGWTITYNQFHITNDTGQEVFDLAVDVNGRVKHLGLLRPGGDVTGRIGRVADEATLHMTGRLADGTVIDEYCGYVVWEDVGRTVSAALLPDGSVRCR